MAAPQLVRLTLLLICFASAAAHLRVPRALATSPSPSVSPSYSPSPSPQRQAYDCADSELQLEVEGGRSFLLQPRAGGDYLPSDQCRWNFTTPSNMYLLLDVFDLDLRDVRDSLQLTWRNASETAAFTFTGPPPLSSDTRPDLTPYSAVPGRVIAGAPLTITFLADSLLQGTGFLARISGVPHALPGTPPGPGPTPPAAPAPSSSPGPLGTRLLYVYADKLKCAEALAFPLGDLAFRLAPALDSGVFADVPPALITPGSLTGCAGGGGGLGEVRGTVQVRGNSAALRAAAVEDMAAAAADGRLLTAFTQQLQSRTEVLSPWTSFSVSDFDRAPSPAAQATPSATPPGTPTPAATAVTQSASPPPPTPSATPSIPGSASPTPSASASPLPGDAGTLTLRDVSCPDVLAAGAGFASAVHAASLPEIPTPVEVFTVGPPLGCAGVASIGIVTLALTAHDTVAGKRAAALLSLQNAANDGRFVTALRAQLGGSAAAVPPGAVASIAVVLAPSATATPSPSATPSAPTVSPSPSASASAAATVVTVPQDDTVLLGAIAGSIAGALLLACIGYGVYRAYAAPEPMHKRVSGGGAFRETRGMSVSPLARQRTQGTAAIELAKVEAWEGADSD